MSLNAIENDRGLQVLTPEISGEFNSSGQPENGINEHKIYETEIRGSV